MREDILERISQLKRIHIPETELDMRIDHKLRQAENLPAQMERVSEP